MMGAEILTLDRRRVPRIGRATWLAEELRTAIGHGVLPPGARLPATRVLADELAMARGTVVEAYQRLAEEGLLVANRGGGTTVARQIATAARRPGTSRTGAARPEIIEISSGMPDLSAFPRGAWLKAERAVLSTATSGELGYADPQGAERLRHALAGWLARSRGVAADADRIIVTAGVTGALSLLAQVLRERGVATCAVEDPGAEGNRRILNYWMEDLAHIPVDESGLDVTALDGADQRAVLVTPAHQFPTGVVLGPQRRRDLVAWADRVDGVIIEDDYDAEYRYDRAPVTAMQAMAPDRVAHVSSLSKVLAPALRLGWLIAPPALHADLVRRRWATDLGSPALSQLTLAQLIETGTLERQLRVLRRRHRARRDAAVAAIRRHLPACSIEGIAAGLHLVVGLPTHLDDAEIAARALDRGVAVHPLSRHRAAPGPPGLIVGYGPHPAPHLERAIAVLGAVIGA